MTDLILERFWDKVKVNEKTGCWEWQSGITNGYGNFHVGNGIHTIRAHRFSYEVNKGKIPQGLQLDHLCRVRKCVNPDHLEPVTSRENSLRGIGLPAIESKRTHCIHGHELTPDNIYYRKAGRQCKKCQNERDKNREFKKMDYCICGHSYYTHNYGGKKCNAKNCDCLEVFSK